MKKISKYSISLILVNWCKKDFYKNNTIYNKMLLVLFIDKKNANVMVAIFVIDMKKHVGTNRYENINSTLFGTQGGAITISRTHLQRRTFGHHCWGCSGSYSYRCSYKKVRGRKGRTRISSRVSSGDETADWSDRTWIARRGMIVPWLKTFSDRRRVPTILYCGKESDGVCRACESLVARNSACSENAFFTLISPPPPPPGKVVPAIGGWRPNPHLSSGVIMYGN